MTGHFEAKKHAYRQTQDGIVVSFVIHPNDLDAGFAVAALGTRYIVAFAEIGDDGRPLGSVTQLVERVDSPERAGSSPAISSKDRRAWSDLTYAEQAGIRCNDPEFQNWLGLDTTSTADWVRVECLVKSRSEIKPNTAPGQMWESVERRFQAWKTDQQYAEARHG